MSSTAMHEAEQDVKDLRAEMMKLERKLQEGLVEAGPLQTRQGRAQDGANRRSRVRSMNAGRQEDLESRIRTEAQEVEALEGKLKAIDTEVQDAQDQLRDAEADLEGLMEERHATVFAMRRIIQDTQDQLRDTEVDLEGLMEERHATASAMKRIKVRQVKANEELAHYKDMRGVISAEARHFKSPIQGTQGRKGRTTGPLGTVCTGGGIEAVVTEGRRSSIA